jgi:glycine/D-amino acid oxidase-like deaminating enzyme
VKAQNSLPDVRKQTPASVRVGVAGLGLMGSSIAACLLAAGHPVSGVESDAARRKGRAAKSGLSSGSLNANAFWRPSRQLCSQNSQFRPNTRLQREAASLSNP